MSKKNKNTELLLSGLGKGCREIYLEANPHGFARTTKVSKNHKKYNRKNNKFNY
jgi:hypothetical protein